MMCKVFNIKAILFWIAALFTITVSSQTIQTYTTVGSQTWTCPVGVTTITVQCWGGGGGGGGAASVYGAAGGGGGGGSYASSVINVTAGNTYTIWVGAGGAGGGSAGFAGANGGASSFNSTVVKAVGGNGGLGSSSTASVSGGNGGAAISCTGTVKYSGGNGGAGTASGAGGGGSSAGTASNGNNANANIGGVAPAGGFFGASYSPTNDLGNNGYAGYIGGSGATGGRRGLGNSNVFGGAGGSGQVALSYCTAMTITSTQTNVSCPGGSTGIIDASVTGGVPYSTAIISDQQQTNAGCAVGGLDSWQSFTPNVNGKFSSIDLLLGANTGNWYVYEGEGIAGNLLSSGTYTCGAFSWFNIPVPNTPPLIPGQKYTFRLTTTSATWQIYCSGDIYPGGKDNNNYDRGFQTNMIPNPFSYVWSNGSITEDVSNLVAGTYTLTVTDAVGCSASKTTTVITNPTALAITSTQTNVTCFGGSNGLINATVTGGVQITQTAVVDQQQPTGGCGTTTSNFWQSFTPAISGQFSSIDVRIYTNSVSVGTWYVYSGAGQAGTVLASGSYNIAAAGGAQWRTISIAGTPILLAGQQYTFRMSSVDWSQACGGSVYAGGTNNSGTGDLAFITNMIPNPYTYAWSNGAVTEDISNLTAGSYTLTVTDAAACSVNSSTTITSAGALAIIASASPTAICVGSSVNLTATGASTYTWNPSAFTGSLVSVSPIATTIYTVTGTSAQNCSNSQMVTVNVDPASVAGTASANQSICTGQVPSAITLTGFTGAIQWQSSLNNSTWTTISGATTNALTSAQMGALVSATYYRATVTSGLCTSVTSNVILITVNAYPTVSVNSATICSGSSTVLAASGATTYSWNTGATTSTISVSPTSTTVYTVTGTTSGCATNKTQTLSVVSTPTISVNSATICAGATAPLTANGAMTYSWAPGSNLSATTGLSVTSSPSITTIYTITGTDANGCSAINTSTVTVNNNPTLTATSSPTALCVGYSANLTATGASTYTWSPGALTGTLVSVNPSATTIYTVTGTSAVGCIKTQTVSLLVNPNLPLSATISSSSTTICSGSSVSFSSTQTNAGSSPTYQWQLNGIDIPGATFPTFTSNTLNNNDVISLIMTANEFCTTNSPAFSNSITMTVNPNLPLSTSIITSTTTICSGSTLSFSATEINAGTSPTYQWLLNGSNILGATFTTFSSNTLNDYDAISLMMTANELCTTNSPAYSNDIFITVIPNPILSLSATSNTICLGSTSSLNASGANSYTWTPGLLSGSIITVTPTINTTYIVEGENSSGCVASDSILIVVNPLPIASAALPSSDSICYNGAVGLALNSQAGITSFSWTSSYGATINAQNPTFTNVTDVGNVYYYGSVEDINGCVSLADTVLVVVAPSLTLSALTSDVSCFGYSYGFIDLSAAGGFAPYSFSWSNSALTEDLSLIPAGNYSVTVNDASTCTSSLSVIITEPTQLDAIVNITTTIACNGGNAVVNITATGGTGPYTGAETYTVAAGNYTYTVTDANGCSSNTTISVTEPTQIVANVNITTPISCNGGNAILTVTAAGGTVPYAGTGTFTVTAGNYTYTVTDANGCSSTTTISVTEPTQIVATANITTPIACNGGNAILTVTATGGTGPYAGAGTFTVAAGNYTYTVTDANGCSSSTTINVTEPVSIVVNVSITTPIACNGGNAILTVAATGGTGPYTGAGTFTVAAGNYTYTVTDANGCSSNTTISVTEPTQIVANVNITTPISCNGGNAILTVTAAGGTVPYSGTGTFTVAAGNYTYTVTDANSCSSTTTISVTEPTPIVANVSITTPITCNGGNAILTVTATGGTIPYAGSGTFTVTAGNYTYTVADANGCSSTTTISVTEPTQILANLSITSPISCNGGNAILTVTAAGGTVPYAGTGTFTVTAGNYTYTVTDANGCSSTTTISVTEPTTIVANVSITTPITCNGGNAILTVAATGGTGPYAGSGTFTVAAGNYTYTVTDANGCSSTTTISVTEPTQIVATANITTPIACNGDSAILAVTATGGTGPYTGTGTFTVAAGNYTYTVTDANGCSSNTTITVTEPASIVANVSITTPILCNGGTAILTVTATGGTGPYTGTGTFTVAAGNYTYTVTDANGCSSSTTINVTEPASIVANVSITTPITCNGGNAILTVAATGGTGPYAGTGTYTVAAGNYTYTVTDANGCSSNTTISVTEPTQIVANVNITTPISCNGGNAILTVTAAGGTGPYTGTGTFTVTAGNYTYTVTDANGCSSSTTINVTEPVSIVVNVSITTPITCNGGNAILTVTATGGTGPYAGAGTFTVAAGNYTYTVADANGCSSSTTVNVTEPTQIVANVSITSPILCNGGTAILTVTATGGTGPYTGTGTFTVAAGNYTYTVTDANGCSSNTTISVTEPTQIVANVNITTPISCNGGNAILTVTAAGGRIPYTGSGTFTVTAGNYTYTVTDANGCSSTTTINLTEPTPIVANVSITTPISCNGGNAILTVSATGGTGPYTGTGTYTVAAGNYTYTVTDANGCSNTATVSVTEPTPIVVNVSIASPISCNGGNAILTVSAIGGTGPYTGTGTYTVAAGNYTYTVTDANGCSSSTTVNVTEPTQIAVNVSITTPISCNGDSAILTVTATGGAGLYAGTGTFIVSAGNYTFTVTDANGCSSTTTITVTEPVSIVANVSITTPITCNGGNAILTVAATGGTGPYAGAGTFTVAAGNYTYTVTDANGCSSTTTISVTEPTTIVANVSITTPIACNGDSAILAVTATGGVGLYAGTGTFTVAAGNYTYTVTDANGCSNNATITVTQPSPVLLIASATNSIICIGQNTILNGTGVNTYTWSPGLLLGASVTVTPNASTIYTVNGTNGAGCLGTQTISININSLPVVNAGASQTICTGQSVTLAGTGSATSYTWNNGVVNNQAFTPTISNSYIVVGTDVNSCSNTDTVEVIINPILSLSLSASNNSICIGNSVILSANGATTYTWNPGLLSGASVTVNPTSSITYSVNGDNGTGCVGSETISLLVQQLPNVVATASSTNICVGQTVSLAGSGATNYNWNNGVIDGIAFSPTTTNSYIVSGTDIFGCTSTTTILVNVYSGTAAIPSVNPGVICIGDTSYLSVIGGSIPTWSLNSNPNLLYVAPITDVSYTYSAVDNNGCIGDIIFNISIDEACAIKVYNGFTPNGDGINDFWIIDNIENYSTNKVYIYNRWGTLMYSTSNYNNFDNVWDGKYNGQAVSSGTYFYVIESNQLIKKGWIEITN